MRKRFLWISSSFFLPVGFFVVYLLNSGPQLPTYAYEEVKALSTRQVVDLRLGESGYAWSGGLRIWYEVSGDSAGEPIMLINGLGGTAFTWQPDLIHTLLDQGYRVIRFDHRDLGASDKVENWDADQPYTLEDMAQDAFAIQDTLGIEKMHVLGYSMGGMIAQRMAIEHPERLNSLTLVSTSGYMTDPELTALSHSMKVQLLRFLVKGWFSMGPRKGIYQNLEAQTLLRNKRQLTREEVDFWMDIHSFNSRNKRVDSKEAGNHQVSAIMRSGSRLEPLTKLPVPTLIFHGTADPLILPEHGQKLQAHIPHSEFHWIEDMAHILCGKHVKEMEPFLFHHLAQHALYRP